MCLYQYIHTYVCHGVYDNAPNTPDSICINVSLPISLSYILQYCNVSIVHIVKWPSLAQLC